MNSITIDSENNYKSIALGSENTMHALKEKIANESWIQADEIVEAQYQYFQGDKDFIMSAAEVKTEVGDFPAALKAYHQMLDLVDDQDPILFEVYKNMGNLYLKCGDMEAAEEKYNLANAIDSRDETLIVNYGVLAIQKGQYEEAKGRFAEVVEINDASDLAWVGLGLVHRAHGDHELARACLQRGLDENPYNKLAITNFYQWCFQDSVDATTHYIGAFLEKYPEDQEMTKLASGLSN